MSQPYPVIPQRSGGGSGGVANPATSTIFANGQSVATNSIIGNVSAGLTPQTAVISGTITGIVDGGGSSPLTSTSINPFPTYQLNYINSYEPIAFYVANPGHFTKVVLNRNPNIITASAITTYGASLAYSCLDSGGYNADNNPQMIMGVTGGGLYTATRSAPTPVLATGTGSQNWIDVSIDANNLNIELAITSANTLWYSTNTGVSFTQNSSVGVSGTYVAVDITGNVGYILTTTGIWYGAPSGVWTQVTNTPTITGAFSSFALLIRTGSFVPTKIVVTTTTGAVYFITSPTGSAVWTLMTAIANDGTLVSGTLVRAFKSRSNTGGMVIATPNGKLYTLPNTVIQDGATTDSNTYNTSTVFTDLTGVYWYASPSLNKSWTALAIGGNNLLGNNNIKYGMPHPQNTRIYAGLLNDALYCGNGSLGLTLDCDILTIRTSSILRSPPLYQHNSLSKLTPMPYTVIGTVAGSTATTGFAIVNLAVDSSYYSAFSYFNASSYTVTAAPTTTVVGDAPNLVTINLIVYIISNSSFRIYWGGNIGAVSFSIRWTASGV